LVHLIAEISKYALKFSIDYFVSLPTGFHQHFFSYVGFVSPFLDVGTLTNGIILDAQVAISILTKWFAPPDIHIYLNQEFLCPLSAGMDSHRAL